VRNAHHHAVGEWRNAEGSGAVVSGGWFSGSR
jgi:hypothetical protein